LNLSSKKSKEHSENQTNKQGACSDLYAETIGLRDDVVPRRVAAPLSACSLTLKISFGPTLASSGGELALCDR